MQGSFLISNIDDINIHQPKSNQFALGSNWMQPAFSPKYTAHALLNTSTLCSTPVQIYIHPLHSQFFTTKKNLSYILIYVYRYRHTSRNSIYQYPYKLSFQIVTSYSLWYASIANMYCAACIPISCTSSRQFTNKTY